MTRILHFGDVHYEEAKHRRSGADGIDLGWRDVANAVDHLVDTAIEQHVAAIAFGGDLARTRKPSPQTYAHFAAAIGRARAAGIPTIAIPGNHDIASNGEANALDPLAHLDGFHLLNEPGVAWIRMDDAGEMHVSRERVAVTRPHLLAELADPPLPDVQDPETAIICVPWLQRSVAAANLPADTPLEQVLDAMSAGALAIIRDLAMEPLAAGVPTFLLYHGTVMGGMTATGQAAHLFHEPVLSAVDLDTLGLAGVMLNHLHKRQDLAADRPGSTPIVYSSSVERLTFGDEADTKGGALWTVPATGPATYEWIDTAARPFVTITEFSGIWPTVTEAIVRVRAASAEADVQQADVTSLERQLLGAGAHRITEIVVETEDSRVEHAAADLARTDPIEALEQWITTEHPDATDETRLALIAAARVLVSGDSPYQGDVTGGASPTTVPSVTPVSDPLLDSETGEPVDGLFTAYASTIAL